ncbi:SusC/RagA family TonB-linked outer membrane protein [Pedobacter nyackensis]|uniref:SusC/RagA family TonB-linked outer membrane protein n=1 Tax=Pedobacter nyackensis TaxID=475255 RepID=UPI00292ED559|nr:SusC/RagA family TonB-linked outer membrane protein [Pedobacter nyackensis]
MKLIAILLTVACLQVSAEGFSQKITLSKNSASLKSVLQEIRKQSGYQLLYNTDLIQKAKPVSINVQNSNLEDALRASLKGQNFTYEIADKMILIKPVPVDNGSNLRWQALKQIRGKVITADGHPLPGVVITEKGTTNKTSTNGEGEFELRNAADDAVLVFSYIGYNTQEIATKGTTRPLNVTLTESDNKLQEVNVVVSTGYQNIPKERATGSFSFVDQKKLGITNLASTDFAKGLEGLVPGLLVGPDGRMQIRGASSLKAATREVLIVVDGFPMESGNFTVNPNDIESVTVLKDAAAASIWGVRASNGVVVIKTKSGMANDGKAVFNFTSNLTLTNKPDFSFQRLASSSDYIDAEAESYRKNWVDFGNADVNPYSLVGGLFYKKYLSDKNLGPNFTEAQLNSGLDQLRQYNALNEQDLFYRRAVQRQLNLSVRGGTEKYTFAISTLYTNELTNLVGKNNDNLILNFKNSLQVLPKVVLSLGINTTYAKSNGSNTGYDYSSARPYNRILDENGNYVSRTSRVSDHMKQSYYNNGYLNWDDNALQNMENTTTKKNTFASRINVGADYEIIKGLTFSSQFQTELRTTNDENLQGIDAYYPRLMANTWRVPTTPGNFVNKFPRGPVFDKGKENQNSWTFRNVANLDKQFGTDHAISAIAGMELRKVAFTSNTERYYNYNPIALTSDNIDLAALGINQPTGLGTNSTYTWFPNFVDRDRRFFSLFANAAYTYKSRYTVSGSIRTDESNLFGSDPKYRYRPLWSAGASWNMTNEDFMSTVGFLDKLIVRATYGVNGNIGNSSPYPIASTGKNFNTQENMLTFKNPENQALRPEKTASTNFGIDFAVLHHRISGSVDFYKKKSYDLLGNSILDPTTGFPSAEKNTASMTNHGIELNLNTRILEGDVRLDADFNIGYNKNKVTNVLTPNTNAAAYVNAVNNPIAGMPIAYLYSYKWAGLSDKGEPQIYDANGNIKSWSTARLTDIKALRYMGTMDPPVYGGMMINVGYKGFTFSPQFTFKMGHVMRLNTTKTDLTAGVTSDIANRWKAPGDELHTNIPTLYSKSTIDPKWDDYYRKSDVWTDDASFIRLRSLSLSYQMPKKFLFNVFTAASLTAQANNVWLWTANKQGLDPDYVNLLTGSIGFPPVKNYVFSLNLNF